MPRSEIKIQRFHILGTRLDSSQRAQTQVLVYVYEMVYVKYGKDAIRTHAIVRVYEGHP